MAAVPLVLARRALRKIGAGWQGCPLCSRPAHSGSIGSGPGRMECSVDARSEGQPSHPLPEKIRWMECRVPVALRIATGDDARSEGQPSHPPPEKIRWMVCRGPVAVQIATGDDARN